MLYDVIVTNKETNQAEVVKYLIRFDTMKIKLLRDKLAEHPGQNVELISKLDSLLNYDFRPIFYILSKEELDDDDVILKVGYVIPSEQFELNMNEIFDNKIVKYKNYHLKTNKATGKKYVAAID